MSFLPPIKQHESTGSEAHGSRQLHLASSVILILGMLLIGLALKGPMVPVQAAPIVDHPSASVIYVSWSATGLNTGTSWVDAYTSLQSALTAAANGDEIWVAAGIYTPTLRTNPSDQRTATFQLKSGVGLYGGFAGSETARDQRDWNTHISVLSGDLDSNDITYPNGVVTNTTCIVGNNAYHVLSSGNVVSTTVLDGFIVTGGQATASAPNNRGGGLYNDGGSPRVAHMTFSGNRAGYGGGVYDEIGSNLTLVNVTFNSNSAQASGGGVLDDRGAVTMINTVFNGNVAATEGGGLYVRYDTATLENCVFNGNISGTTGGGLWNEAGQSTVVNCTFSGNTAPIEGGALYDWGVGTASIIRNSILWGNTAPTNPQIGGGTANVSTSLVQGGWSGTGNLSADPQFVRNPSPGLDGTWGTSDDDYGDLHLRPTSPAIDAGNNSAVPTDSTDLDGNPRILGGVVDLGAYETPLRASKTVTPTTNVPYHGVVTYTVVLANYQGIRESNTLFTDTLPTQVAFGEWVERPEGAQVSTDGLGHDVITRSGVLTDHTVLTFTFTAMHIGDYGDVVTNTAQYSGSLVMTSSATFSAIRLYTLTVATTGPGSGVVTPTVGVYTYTPGTVVTLTASPNPPWVFGGWDGACTGAGDCVVMMDANKAVTATFRLLRLYVDKNASSPIHDGFSWTTAYTNVQAALSTAISGDEIWVAAGVYTPTARLVPGDPRSATFELRSGVALYGGFSGVETSLMERDWKDHPVILSGDISETNVITDNVYQVVYSSNVVSTTLLDGFTVTGGYADGPVESQRRGGGMRNVGGSPTIQHSVFNHNYAIYGGGMYNYHTSLVLRDVTIQQNTTQLSGGGVLNDNSDVLLLNTVFLSNTGGFDGGALYNYYSNDVRIVNSLFVGNVAHKDGGVMFNEITDPILINSTLSRNTSVTERTYICNWGGSRITVTNSIVWGNSDALGNNTIFGVAAIDHSVVQDGWSGTGNLDSNPQFVDAAAGDFRLNSSSPAIDAGDNTAVLSDTLDLDGDGDLSERIPFDLDNRARFIDVLVTPDTGNGTAPIVDMGAYETPIRLYLPLIIQDLSPGR